MRSRFSILFTHQGGFRLQDIRWSRIQYMLIFSLAPIFIDRHPPFFAHPFVCFGLDAMTLMGIAYCVGAGILFAFAKVRNIALYARRLSLVAALCYSAALLLPESVPAFVSSIAFMFTFGGCAALTVFGFTYALNNVERFFAATITSFFFVLMELDYSIGFLSRVSDQIYLAVLVLGTLFCLQRFRTEDYIQIEQRPQDTLNPSVILMLYFFAAHKLIAIFFTYLPGFESQAALFHNGLAGILTVALAFLIHLKARYSVWHMCNLFFLAMLCSYLLYFLGDGPWVRSLAFFFHGFEQMGFIVSYYLLGCVLKKYTDFSLFKKIVIVALNGFLLFYMVPGLIAALSPEALPFAAIAFSIVAFIVFVMSTSLYVQHLFSAEWSDEFQCVDVTLSKEEQEKGIAGFDLTPREKEVALLLMEGLALKDIAERLDITVNTVKFHTKNIYKKLNINSRTQLLLIGHSEDRQA